MSVWPGQSRIAASIRTDPRERCKPPSPVAEYFTVESGRSTGRRLAASKHRQTLQLRLLTLTLRKSSYPARPIIRACTLCAGLPSSSQRRSKLLYWVEVGLRIIFYPFLAKRRPHHISDDRSSPLGPAVTVSSPFLSLLTFPPSSLDSFIRRRIELYKTTFDQHFTRIVIKMAPNYDITDEEVNELCRLAAEAKATAYCTSTITSISGLDVSLLS